MLIEIIIILITGFMLGKIFDRMGLPKILGYLITGILFQLIPIEASILSFKKEITTFALSVILLKAGLGIDSVTLKKVGGRAILLGIIPNIFEGTVITVLSMTILKLPFIEAGMLGFIVSPISPAVVIPSMIKLKDKGYNGNGVPVLNLASASIDDIISVLIFSIFLSLYLGGVANDSIKSIITPIAYIIIMMFGFFINKLSKHKDKIISLTNKIWSIAQVYLFVIIGLLVNTEVAFTVGFIAIVIIIVGLLFRLLGVFICLQKSIFKKSERLFCMIANLPKATVQASLGAVPLIYGVTSGEMILAISALSIIVTAPIGLIFIEKFGPLLLSKQN
ncbi:cation:proton antiporter [Mycoplasmatota bacterium]|nr:cation:proton antiporter [Mycoplasmatota bacterium]